MLGYVLDVPLEAGAAPLRVPGSGLPPLPLDAGRDASSVAPALAERLDALAGELGVARAAVSGVHGWGQAPTVQHRLQRLGLVGEAARRRAAVHRQALCR